MSYNRLQRHGSRPHHFSGPHIDRWFLRRTASTAVARVATTIAQKGGPYDRMIINLFPMPMSTLSNVYKSRSGLSIWPTVELKLSFAISHTIPTAPRNFLAGCWRHIEKRVGLQLVQAISVLLLLLLSTPCTTRGDLAHRCASGLFICLIRVCANL
jgi:hypothetical protein